MSIFVKPRRDGFCRCGVRHPGEGRSYRNGFFTDEQIQIMAEDPDILVVAGEPDEDPEIDFPVLERQDTRDGDTLTLEELTAAAKQAIEDGNTIKSGAPSVPAMEEILGRNITPEQRNQAWASVRAEGV